MPNFLHGIIRECLVFERYSDKDALSIISPDIIDNFNMLFYSPFIKFRKIKTDQ